MPTNKKFRKRHNLRLIKQDDAYAPKEIMELFSITRPTLCRWRKCGLKTIDSNHPILFHGTDLYEFLAKQQSDRRNKLKASEFYCMSCKKATTAKIGSEHLVRSKADKPIIKANCNICGQKINRFPSQDSL